MSNKTAIKHNIWWSIRVFKQ